MSGNRDIGRPWSEIEHEIADDSETKPFNVEIPKSLKLQIAVEKEVSGDSYKTIVTRALVAYLREKHRNGGAS